MMNQIAKLSPKTKFILLQLVALGLAFGTPSILLLGFRWIWQDLLCLAGASMAVVGMVRCVREGQRTWRLLRSCAWVYLVSLVCWIVLTILLPELLGFRTWAAAFYMEAPCLTTGSLAYFGLGPFRLKASLARTVQR
jgi:hypothetical protein